MILRNSLNMENNLNEFTSNIMYSYFEDGKGNCGNIDFHSDINDELILYPNLRRISDKFSKALCYVYYNKKKNPQDFDKELCSYLYYWIGYKIYSNSSETGVFSKLIRTFFDLLNNKDFSYICDNPKTEIDKETFENNKLLFDYSKNLVNIKHHTVYGDATCDEKYKEFLQNYIKIYKDTYSSCKLNSQNKYDCEYFNKLYRDDQYKELSSFYCRNYKAANFSAGIQETTPNKFPLPGVRGSDRNHSPEIHRASGRNNPPRFDYVSNPNPSSPVTHTLNEGESTLIDDTSQSSSSKTIAGSVVSVLGVSSFSLLLYKVTQVGGYINRLLGRNRNMYNQIEYLDEFNPYSEGMDPVGRRMNIAYNRL